MTEDETFEVPEFLYHGTKHENLRSIVGEGLRAGWGGVFFVNESRYGAGFVKLYGGGSGKAYVVRVRTSDLELEKLSVSNDHAPMFFPEDMVCWVYDGDVGADVIDDEIELFEWGELG